MNILFVLKPKKSAGSLETSSGDEMFLGIEEEGDHGVGFCSRRERLV